jgi:hypothetical protein
MASLYKDILNEVLAEIRTLDDATSAITDSSEVRRLDWDSAVKQKGVQVCWTRPRSKGVVCDREDRGYPCHIVMCQGGKEPLSSDVDLHFDFFQKIRRHFHEQRVVSDFVDAGSCLLPQRVTEGDVPGSVRENYNVHHIIIWVWVRESRTNA